MQDKLVSLIGWLVLMFLGALAFSWLLAFAGLVSIILAVILGVIVTVLYPIINREHKEKRSASGQLLFGFGVMLACISAIPMLPISDYCSHQYGDKSAYNSYTNLTYTGYGSHKSLCEETTAIQYEIEYKPLSLLIRLALLLSSGVLIFRALKNAASSSDDYRRKARIKKEENWKTVDNKRCLAQLIDGQNSGSRCKNKRWSERYCKRHAEMYEKGN